MQLQFVARQGGAAFLFDTDVVERADVGEHDEFIATEFGNALYQVVYRSERMLGASGDENLRGSFAERAYVAKAEAHGLPIIIGKKGESTVPVAHGGVDGKDFESMTLG